MDQEMMEPNEPRGVSEGQEPNGPGIDAQQIEAGIKDKLAKKQSANLDRILQAGQELLFGKDSHYQMLKGIESSHDIGGDLGKGAFGMAMMLIKQSGGTIPGDVIIPAGIILLARLTEFMNSEGSGMPHVTDDDYEEATHVFSTLIMDKLDPQFKDKVAASGVQPAPEQPQQQQALLNQGV